jgi:hypothetical protein
VICKKYPLATGCLYDKYYILVFKFGGLNCLVEIQKLPAVARDGMGRRRRRRRRRS